jgi:hypothetical protein
MSLKEILCVVLDNTIGQNSSWFWTMAQAFVVAISLIFIYRQIKAQRVGNSLAALKALDDRWRSPEYLAARQSIAKAYPSTDKSLGNDEYLVLSFFEEIGIYVKNEVFDLEPVWDLYSYYIEHYWPILLPRVSEYRITESDDSYYDRAQLLYDKCCALSKKRKANPKKTEVQLAQFVEGESGLGKKSGSK